MICRQLKLLAHASVAVDGSKFKAVNNRDRNFTPRKLEQRMRQVEESIERYLSALETADRTQPADVELKTARLQDELTSLRQQMKQLRAIGTELQQLPASNCRSPTRMLAQWPPAGVAPGWWATTCNWRRTPSTT